MNILIIVDDPLPSDINCSIYDRVICTHFYASELNKNFKRYLNWSGSDVTPNFVNKTARDSNHIIKYATYGLPDEFWDMNSSRVYLPQKAHFDVIGHDTDASVMAVAFQLFDHKYDFSVLEKYCYSSGGQDIHEKAIAIMKRNFGSAIK